MSDFLQVLAVSLLPAGGNILGALMAENVRTPPWIIGAALHGAAGVAIAVVSVDLMPRILPIVPNWLLVAAFAGGAALSVALSALFRAWTGGGRSRSGAWMVLLAVSVDLLTDGLVVGAGSAVASRLGLLLGLSQVVANIPGGFATIGNFRNRQVPRVRRLAVSAAFVLPSSLGAALGFWLLRGESDVVEHTALAFLVGMLLLATVEDMLPQADEPGTARWISTLSFTVGFAVFAVLSAYLS